MTRAQRLRLARTLHVQRAMRERTLEAQLRHELRAAMLAAARAYPDWQGAIRQHRSRVAAILIRELSRSAVLAARTARQMAKMYLPGEVEEKLDTQEELDARAMAVARKRAAQIADDVSETTRKRMATVIQDAIAAHDTSEGSLSNALVDLVGDLDMARARTIARTETSIAMNTAQHDSVADTAESLGLEFKKVWTATEDARTRESHTQADGQEVGLDEPFRVDGEELMYPSDPAGSPENIIICRCVALYVPA